MDTTKYFFQRRHTNGKHAYEKMLNITNDQRNVNQNHTMATKMVRNNKCWWQCDETGMLKHC